MRVAICVMVAVDRHRSMDVRCRRHKASVLLLIVLFVIEISAIIRDPPRIARERDGDRARRLCTDDGVVSVTVPPLASSRQAVSVVDATAETEQQRGRGGVGHVSAHGAIRVVRFAPASICKPPPALNCDRMERCR